MPGTSSPKTETRYYPMPEENEGRPATPESASSRSSRSSRRSRRKHRRSDSIGSSGSFSQSEDFRKMLKNEKGGQEVDDEEPEVYIVRQKHAYCSILFSVAQLVVLILMMIECGVAPININYMIGPYPDALSDWGGKNAINILEDGEWWRLITPILLHAGLIHLVCNVAVQLETGAFFEREWGSRNWFIIYLVSAVGSSILSVIIMPDAISVGSSGAVMGLFGGKLAEVICRYNESDKSEQGRIGHQVRNEQCGGVMCSVTVVLLFSFVPFVDWAAHLGGLIAGFCIGMVIFALETEKPVWKVVWLIVGVALTLTYFVVTLHRMYSGEIEPAEELRDVCGYYKQYFEDYECNCMREEHGSGD